MRKQLMTGVAAAAICLGLASCSRYDYTLISEGEQAYVNYENAFIEKFGEPAPDQTWGFGSADANGGGVAQGAITRAATRAIQPFYTFPSDAASEKFLSNVPDGVEYYGNKNYGNVPLEYVSDEESILMNKFFVRSLRFRCNELNTVRC